MLNRWLGRDGCPLIRNLISATAEHLARTANVQEAAALVKETVAHVMQV